MNTKFIAIKRTAIMVLIACVVPLLISFLLTFDSEQIGWTMLGAIFVYAVYILYIINLHQVRHDILIQESHDKLQAIIDSKKV